MRYGWNDMKVKDGFDGHIHISEKSSLDTMFNNNDDNNKARITSRPGQSVLMICDCTPFFFFFFRVTSCLQGTPESSSESLQSRELILHDLRWGEQGLHLGIVCITLHSIRCLMDAWWWGGTNCPFARGKSRVWKEHHLSLSKNLICHSGQAALLNFHKKEPLLLNLFLWRWNWTMTLQEIGFDVSRIILFKKYTYWAGNVTVLEFIPACENKFLSACSPDLLLTTWWWVTLESCTEALDFLN